MFIRPLLMRNAVRAFVLAGTLFAAAALAAAEPPHIFIRFETVELLPDGKENRLSAPRVTTKSGREAMISIEGLNDYVEFKAKPDWRAGKILIESGCEVGRIQPGKSSQPNAPTSRPTPVKPGPAPRLSESVDNPTSPPKKARPKTDRLFPDNLHMKGFAKLPGKPPRIVLLELNHDDEFWIRLGQTVRDIRFVSVDYARSEPEAILENKGQFAKVTISSPIVKRTKPPRRIADQQFTSIDLVTPGEMLAFDLGLSRNGHPQQLRMTAKAWDGDPR